MNLSLAPERAGPGTSLSTRFPFVLPRGYVDARGRVHREGVMRLATARDEIAPQADPRVRANPAYLTVALLARTVVSLGNLPEVGEPVVEDLYAVDLAFLQDLYRQVNQRGDTLVDAACPHCGQGLTVDLALGVRGGDGVGEA